MIKDILHTIVVTALTYGCSQASSAPPVPPQTSVSKDAATNGDSSAGNSSDGKSNISSLLGGSGQLEGDYEVRDRQLKQLSSLRDTYNYEIQQYQQYRTQLIITKDTNGETAFSAAKPGSLGASIIGSLVGVGGAGAVSAFSSVNMSDDSGGSAKGTSNALSSAFGNAGKSITDGIATDDFNNQLKSGTAGVSAEIQSQADQYDAVITNLQAKVAAINSQIDALNAQKLKSS